MKSRQLILALLFGLLLTFLVTPAKQMLLRQQAASYHNVLRSQSANSMSITFEEYDQYGGFDGVSIICLNDITHLVCDSEDESCLKLLIDPPIL